MLLERRVACQGVRDSCHVRVVAVWGALLGWRRAHGHSGGGRGHGGGGVLLSELIGERGDLSGASARTTLPLIYAPYLSMANSLLSRFSREGTRSSIIRAFTPPHSSRGAYPGSNPAHRDRYRRPCSTARAALSQRCRPLLAGALHTSRVQAYIALHD